jgi:hypothetical protein
MGRDMRAAIAIIMLALAMEPARADETYVCGDGRTLVVTQANREKLADDPCIRAWHEKVRGGPTTAASVTTAAASGAAPRFVKFTRAGRRR